MELRSGKQSRLCPCLALLFYPSIPSSLPPRAALESAEVSQAKTESSGGNYQTDRDGAVRYLPELYGGGFYHLSLLLRKQDETLVWFLEVCLSLFFFVLLEHIKQNLNVVRWSSG